LLSILRFLFEPDLLCYSDECSSVHSSLTLKGDGRGCEVSFESADLTWLIMGHDLSGILILVFVMSLSCDYHVRFM